MGKKSERKSLAASIERETNPPEIEVEVINDSVGEEDLLDFTNAFLDDFRNLQPMEPINLLTQEGAQKAVEMLEVRKRMLDQKLKTVGTLRRMLQKRGSGESYQ